MMTRRQVLELTVSLGSLGAAGVVAVACSSDEKTGTSSGGPAGNDAGGGGGKTDGGGAKDGASDTGGGDTAEAFACRSSIQLNHGHVLTIPVADLDSTSPKTYSIIGTADHDHQVTFDARQLADLKAGVSVQVTSTNGGTTHDHDIAVKCS